MKLSERFNRFFSKEGGQAIVVKSHGQGALSLSSEDVSKRVELYKQYQRAYDRIPLVTAIIDVQADQTVQEFFFEGPNEEKISKFADDINLLRFFHRITKPMLLYGNAYTEVVKEGEKITELKILDSIYIDVWRKPTGDIIGYTQIIGDKKMVLWGTTGKKTEDAKFKKRIPSIDSIAHFRYNVLGSDKYGRSVIGSMMSNLQTKLDMEIDLKKVLFKYVAPLIWAKVGSNEFPANTEVVNEISGTLRNLQAESEITTSHLVELGVLDFNAKGMDIKTPLVYTDQQIVTGGHVPPLLMGMPGEGKEANAEVQLRNFGRHIKSIQRELKYEFEDQIIVKQGLGTEEDKLIWEKSEEREWENDVDILRGLVTDGVLTAQKANDLLPPRFHEKLPEIDPLNQQATDLNGQQVPRPNQMKNDKVKDNPANPRKTIKNPKSLGKRVVKNDKEVPLK